MYLSYDIHSLCFFLGATTLLAKQGNTIVKKKRGNTSCIYYTWQEKKRIPYLGTTSIKHVMLIVKHKASFRSCHFTIFTSKIQLDVIDPIHHPAPLPAI